jgi:hypothetical protein
MRSEGNLTARLLSKTGRLVVESADERMLKAIFHLT